MARHGRAPRRPDFRPARLAATSKPCSVPCSEAAHPALRWVACPLLHLYKGLVMRSLRELESMAKEAASLLSCLEAVPDAWKNCPGEDEIGSLAREAAGIVTSLRESIDVWQS